MLGFCVGSEFVGCYGVVGINDSNGAVSFGSGVDMNGGVEIGCDDVDVIAFHFEMLGRTDFLIGSDKIGVIIDGRCDVSDWVAESGYAEKVHRGLI